MTRIDTWVCLDGTRTIYPARVDPDTKYRGHVTPSFTLDTVRRLAEHLTKTAEDRANKNMDAIKVIDDGSEPTVLHIRPQAASPDAPDCATTIVEPDDEGRYLIGDEWAWYIVEDGPLLFHTRNAAQAARERVLRATERRLGEILRTQFLDAASCLVDLSGPARIVQVEGTRGTAWPIGTDTDGYGPFGSERLREADELIRHALTHFGDPIDLEVNGWGPARGTDRPELHRIAFTPPYDKVAGDRPLQAARRDAERTRRRLLTESAPYLAREAREVMPTAVGVVATPAALQPLEWFVTADDQAGTSRLPYELVQKVNERLRGLFAYQPTGDDLTACGWRPAPEVYGAYVLDFPAP